jgi:hypothetical protein
MNSTDWTLSLTITTIANFSRIGALLDPPSVALCLPGTWSRRALTWRFEFPEEVPDTNKILRSASLLEEAVACRTGVGGTEFHTSADQRSNGVPGFVSCAAA